MPAVRSKMRFIAQSCHFPIYGNALLPTAPALRLPQAEAAGPSSSLRYGQHHAATSAQLRGPRQPARPNPKGRFVRLALLLGRRKQPIFGPLGARRFHPVNRRRNSFHRVAPATLEYAVLESSDARVYTVACESDTSGREDVRSATVAAIRFRAWMHSDLAASALKIYRSEVGVCTYPTGTRISAP